MTASWIQTIPFYHILQNLSPFYICSIVISVVAVLLTWYFTKSKQVVQPNGEYQESVILKKEKETTPSYEFHVVSKMKRAKQKAIEKLLTEQLSEEQLQHEKEIEKKQLSEIFKLLQEQGEKFHINSTEELHEQLKLYKNQ